MTVAEYIFELLRLPQDAPVVVHDGEMDTWHEAEGPRKVPNPQDPSKDAVLVE